MINVNGRNGKMITYDNFTTLSSHETFTSLRTEFIATTFNANTRKAIHKNMQIFNIILINVHNSPS
jgi:predicted transglutaminase-like protease